MGVDSWHPVAMSQHLAFNTRQSAIKLTLRWQLLAACGHCQALLPVDWKINNNTTVQPDNLIVCEKPEGQFLSNAPALITNHRS